MSLPLGGGGVEPEDWWLMGSPTADTNKVSAMATGRTQSAFEAVYKPKVQQSSPWHVATGIWNGIAAGISSAANNAVNAITQIAHLIARVGGAVIEDVGDFLNAARANAQTALTNAGHALGQLGTLIGKVGGQFIDDVGDFINAAKANAQTALTNAQTALANAGISLDGLQNFLDALTSAFGGPSSGNTVATVSAYSIDLAQASLAAQRSAYLAQLAVAALTKNLDAEHDGAVFDMSFTGADGDALNAADWPLTGPTPGDICIRLVSGTPTMGIRAGAATNSTFYVGCGHVYETDDQSFSVIIAGGNTDTTATTRVHFHCDAVGPAATRGLYLDIAPTGLKLGYFTTSAGVRTYTPFGGNGTVAAALSGGMRVEVRNVGNNYQIVLNGGAQPTYVDTANKAVAGDFHAFVTMETKTKVWNAGTPWPTEATRTSYFLAGVLMADYAPVVYKGSGAKMYRTSTATVAAAAGSNVLPDNTFGVEAYRTPDIQVDLTTGKFTVTRDDMYYVTYRVELVTKTGSMTSQTAMAPYPVTMALFKNAALDQMVGETLRPVGYDINGTVTGGGNQFSGSLQARSPDAAAGSVQVPMLAGDYIQLGYSANAANSAVFTGEATGIRTYFEIMGSNS